MGSFGFFSALLAFSALLWLCALTLELTYEVAHGVYTPKVHAYMFCAYADLRFSRQPPPSSVSCWPGSEWISFFQERVLPNDAVQ